MKPIGRRLLRILIASLALAVMACGPQPPGRTPTGSAVSTPAQGEILAEEQPHLFLYFPDALPMIHARFRGARSRRSGSDTTSSSGMSRRRSRSS